MKQLQHRKQRESTNQKWQFVPFKASVSEGCYIVESALASQKVIDISQMEVLQ